MKKIPRDAEASNVLIGEVDFLDKPFVSFVRLAQATTLGGLTEVPVPTRWVSLTSPLFNISLECACFAFINLLISVPTGFSSSCWVLMAKPRPTMRLAELSLRSWWTRYLPGTVPPWQTTLIYTFSLSHWFYFFIFCQLFSDVAYKARDRDDLIAGVDEFLDEVIVLPPGEWDPKIRIEPPKKVPSADMRHVHLTRI